MTKWLGRSHVTCFARESPTGHQNKKKSSKVWLEKKENLLQGKNLDRSRSTECAFHLQSWSISCTECWRPAGARRSPRRMSIRKVQRSLVQPRSRPVASAGQAPAEAEQRQRPAGRRWRRKQSARKRKSKLVLSCPKSLQKRQAYHWLHFGEIGRLFLNEDSKKFEVSYSSVRSELMIIEIQAAAFIRNLFHYFFRKILELWEIIRIGECLANWPPAEGRDRTRWSGV